MSEQPKSNISTISFSLQEFLGATGDLGTDLPLIVALLFVTDLNATLVLSVFGIMQILIGFYYRIPMPVQPLKAMASIVISQKVLGSVLLAAGLSIGLFMFFLTYFGLLKKLSHYIPPVLVKGLQIGLGMGLMLLSLKEYLPSNGYHGFLLASVVSILVLMMKIYKKFPGALLALGIGMAYGFVFESPKIGILFDAEIPDYGFLSFDIMLKGFLLLTLPQIPLSLGNSIFATHRSCKQLFEEREDISLEKIGYSYSFLNIFSPFLGGIPVCHGAGGLIGHYNFGGRTGGSVVIYGLFFLLMGLLFGGCFEEFSKLFPLPMLGVLLFFEGLALVLLVNKTLQSPKEILTVMFFAIIAFILPYGFAIALFLGFFLNLIFKKTSIKF
ncbi:MAG: putative sulfate/molybdate transporter [Cytophagales bacterium]